MREEPATFERLSDYIDGELDAAAKAELEAELRFDAALRAELESLEAARTFLRTHAPRKAPADLLAKVMDKVEHQPIPANDTWGWVRRPFGVPIEALGVVAAAAMIVVIGGLKGLSSLDAGAPEPVIEAPAADMPTAPAAGVATKEEPKDGTADADVELKAKSEAEELHTIPVKVDDDVKAPPPPDAKSIRSTGTAKPTSTPSTSAELKPVGTAAPPPSVEPTPTAQTTSIAGDALEGAGEPASVAPWGYVVRSWGDDPVADLLRLSSRFGGRLTDASGKTVTKGGSVGTYWLTIPKDRVAEVDDALRDLGASPTGPVDARMYFTDTVQMRVDIQTFERGSYK